MDMKEEEHWKQFENSGRIEDYLSFVSSSRQAETEEEDSEKESMETNRDRKKEAQMWDQAEAD